MEHSSASAWGNGLKAIDLMAKAPTFCLQTTCANAFQMFQVDNKYRSLAVVDEQGRVHGLVNRLAFLAQYARQYFPEIYGNKSILKFADTQPIVVDEFTDVAYLGEIVANDQTGDLNCFIVTSNGRYMGLGSGEALLRHKIRLVQKQREALRAALQNSNEAIKAKSNFLALMSHELRTPLNAIIGFSDVIRNELFGPIAVTKYAEYVEDINGAGKHLLALINDILDLAKIEAQKVELKCEDTELNSLIDECTRLMRNRAEESGLRLRISAGAFPTLYVDRLRLKQMILNLLTNAIKFTPHGGSITIDSRRGADGSAVVTVSDTGIGIPSEMISRVLEPFTQVESPMARNAEGTGLGLAIVKALMECHGGELSIESQVGRGTSVSLCFPHSRCAEELSARSA